MKHTSTPQGHFLRVVQRISHTAGSKEEIIIIYRRSKITDLEVLGYRTPYEVFFTDFTKALDI